MRKESYQVSVGLKVNEMYFSNIRKYYSMIYTDRPYRVNRGVNEMPLLLIPLHVSLYIIKKKIVDNYTFIYSTAFLLKDSPSLHKQ